MQNRKLFYFFVLFLFALSFSSSKAQRFEKEQGKIKNKSTSFMQIGYLNNSYNDSFQNLLDEADKQYNEKTIPLGFVVGQQYPVIFDKLFIGYYAGLSYESHKIGDNQTLSIFGLDIGGSLSYFFQNNYDGFYVKTNIGYGSLNLEIKNGYMEDKTKSGFIYGISAGYMLPLTNSFMMYLDLQYTKKNMGNISVSAPSINFGVSF